MEGGTGVYYQAMPAVGPDGRNVMKLIPVQKVNGQFFQTVFNTEKDNVDIQVKVRSNPVLSSVPSSSHSQTRLPSLQPIADGRYVLKAPTQVTTLFSSPKVQQGGTKNIPRPPKQVYIPSANPAISHNAQQLPPQTNGQPMAVVQKLPVTVKSPILPTGHCLQIPSNAQVRTVPASALPPSIKSQIMNLVSISSTNENQQMVVMVSPVNSVKLNSDQQTLSLTKPSQIQKTLSSHLPANTGTSSPLCSPINPKASQEVSTPIKWVVQEESGTRGPCLVPASSTQINPIATKSVKHVELVTSTNNIVASKPTLQISPEQIAPGKDNALVMCNGKVYFVAKKDSEIAKDVMVSEGWRKGCLSVSPALPASSALGSNSSKVTTEPDPKIKASEIIDLCDDEEESSTCLGGSPGNLPTQSQTELDDSSEDSNVIFVSYIPPKSEASAGDKDTNCASQNKKDDIVHGEKETNAKSVSQNESEETEHTEMEIDVGQENTAAEESDAQMDVEQSESGPAESSCESAEGEKQLENEISPGSILTDTTNADGAAPGETVSDREGVFEQLHDICVPATDNTEENFKNPAPDRTTQQKSDCQLRKEFGVISDVRICLQKIIRAEKPNLQAERLVINKRTLDGLRKVIQESKLQSKIQMMMQVPCKKTEEDEGLKEVKRNKPEQDVKDVHQDNSSLRTTNISPASKCKDLSQNVSVFPMENSLILQTCQEFCSSSRNTEEVVKSTASKVHTQSETSTDFSAGTHCLTSSSEQTQTTSHTVSPPSALRKTPVRSKKGKVCTACPCGTVLGVTETTSSLQPAVAESHKETRKSCVHKTPEESCQPVGDHNLVKKARKKKKNSPRKKKSPSKSTCETSHSIISSDCSLNITTSLNASSSNLQESNKEIALSSDVSECNTSSNIHTQDETSEQDTRQMEIALNDTSLPSSSNKQDTTIDELPTQDLYSVEVLDAEEIKRQERIKRLKNLLREKEAALERMRHSMNI